MSTDIRPFRIDIPQDDIDDLRDRLARTRWANELAYDEITDGIRRGPVPPGWEYGVPLSYVRPLVEHWRDDFDWRAQEATLNKHPQFTTDIDGQRVHFLHVRSPEPNAQPLILTHGWPNTFVEYVGLIGPLTDPRSHGGDPADAFDVVIPSIPGIGFSGPTTSAGWGPDRVAHAWAELMRRLGYNSYGAHGNDAGAIISPVLGRLDADHVTGVHVNQIFSFPTGEPTDFDGLTAAELQQLQFLASFNEEMSAFAQLQATKPQNLAHALADSPAGLLAWNGQLLGEAIDRDTLLTIASIYWFTNTAASAARFYYEDRHGTMRQEPTTTPIGLASFANDFRPVRKFVERDHTNLVSWNTYDQGGHWAAHDAPDLLTADIRQFFREHR
jgi:pimeloyl-ACP methyl ester carboxylesterase